MSVSSVDVKDPPRKIGFIGTGIMGQPMAANLLKAGYPLCAFNRSRQRAETLAAFGATIAESPERAAATADIIITMLPDTRAVEEVLFGEHGVASGIAPGATVIDMSTISPRATEGFARRMHALGCAMLDAPVSGGERGAIAGTLGMMVGGPRIAFEQCQGVLQAMGKMVVYTGPSGCGQKTKLVNQLVGATNLLAVVEGLRLARAAGLDPHTTLQAVSSGAAASWMLMNLGPLILKADFRPGFSIRLQHKDLSLLNEWLRELGGDFPAAALVHSLFSRAVEMDLESQGNQGLIHVWEQ